MKKFSPTNSVLSCVLFFFIASCSSTSLVSSWRNPDSTIHTDSLKKWWVMCLVKDEATRRIAEDEMAKRRPGVFVQSYTKYSTDMLRNQTEKVNEEITKSGYDGIVIMRLVDRTQATSYVPGSYPSYYGGWYGYYGYTAPYYSDPGYYRTDEYYSVETNIYTLNPDKLIWSGITETMNPSSVETTIKEIADAIVYKMKSQKFLVNGSSK